MSANVGVENKHSPGEYNQGHGNEKTKVPGLAPLGPILKDSQYKQKPNAWSVLTDQGIVWVAGRGWDQNQLPIFAAIATWPRCVRSEQPFPHAFPTVA